MGELSEERREALVVDVLRQITNVGNLPAWMQVGALGRDLRSLAETVVDAQSETLAEWSAQDRAAVERERDHWKDHAEEVGRGFAQVCRDYARVSATVVRVTDVLNELDRRDLRAPDRVLTFWRDRLRAALTPDADR